MLNNKVDNCNKSQNTHNQMEDNDAEYEMVMVAEKANQCEFTPNKIENHCNASQQHETGELLVISKHKNE